MKVALLLPGYLDSPDYLHMMTFEKGLMDLGYKVERIDSCNLWKTGDANNYTLSNILKQLKERVDYFRNKNAEEILLVGHSMGALTVIIAGSRFKEVSRIVSLCPPSDRKRSAHKWSKGKARISKRDFPDNPNKFREFAIPYSYLEDALKYSAVDEVKTIRKPLMVFIALEDTVVPPSETEIIVKNANNPHVIRQPGMGHDFRHSKKQCKIVMSHIEKFLASSK